MEAGVIESNFQGVIDCIYVWYFRAFGVPWMEHTIVISTATITRMLLVVIYSVGSGHALSMECKHENANINSNHVIREEIQLVPWKIKIYLRELQKQCIYTSNWKITRKNRCFQTNYYQNNSGKAIISITSMPTGHFQPISWSESLFHNLVHKWMVLKL